MNDFIVFPSGKRVCRKHFKESCSECNVHPLISNGNLELDNNQPLNHISGGRVGSVQADSMFYNPHNARFYFKFNKWSFSPHGEFKSSNYGSELSIDFDGCRFVVKKFSVEVTNKVDSLRLFPIHGSEVDIKDLKDGAIEVLRGEVVSALKNFVSRFGGVAEFIPYREWIPDNKVSHHPIIDSIPKGVTWRNDVCKKVYPDEQNVEYSSPVFVENALTNLALSKFSPEIVSEIQNLKGEITLLAHESRILAEHFNSHIPLIQEATISLRDDVKVKEETLLTLKAIRNAHSGEGVPSHFTPPRFEVVGRCSKSPLTSLPTTISKNDSKGLKALKLSGWL